MILLVHRNRLLVYQNCTDGGGAFFAFAPAGAQINAGASVIAAQDRINTEIHRAALRVDKHDAIVGITNLVMQATQLVTGQAQKVVQMFFMFKQLVGFEYARALQRTWIQPVLLHRAAPGFNNAGGQRQGRRTLGGAQYPAYMIEMCF